jgi:hypothetical protein
MYSECVFSSFLLFHFPFFLLLLFCSQCRQRDHQGQGSFWSLRGIVEERNFLSTTAALSWLPKVIRKTALPQSLPLLYFTFCFVFLCFLARNLIIESKFFFLVQLSSCFTPLLSPVRFLPLVLCIPLAIHFLFFFHFSLFGLLFLLFIYLFFYILAWPICPPVELTAIGRKTQIYFPVQGKHIYSGYLLLSLVFLRLFPFSSHLLRPTNNVTTILVLALIQSTDKRRANPCTSAFQPLSRRRKASHHRPDPPGRRAVFISHEFDYIYFLDHFVYTAIWLGLTRHRIPNAVTAHTAM